MPFRRFPRLCINARFDGAARDACEDVAVVVAAAARAVDVVDTVVFVAVVVAFVVDAVLTVENLWRVILWRRYCYWAHWAPGRIEAGVPGRGAVRRW